MFVYFVDYPQLLYEADFKKNFRASHYGLLVIAAILVAFIVWPLRTLGGNDKFNNASVYLFVRLRLDCQHRHDPSWHQRLYDALIMGAYPTVIEAIKTLDFVIIIVVGLGIAGGLLITSKIIRYLFQHYSSLTYAALTGLVVGSIFVVYPGWPGNASLMIASIITLIAGFSLATFIGRMR